MIGDIFEVLATGAGGGIVGGVLGLFRQWGERRERLEYERLQLERDQLEASERASDRAHELEMAQQGAASALAQVQAEGEAAAEVANQGALEAAQRAEFGGLDTSRWMDNLRASVRPVFAYWVMIVFSAMVGYFAIRFYDQITPETGSEILLALIDTLVFMVTSITTFYYVSRRNQPAR